MSTETEAPSTTTKATPPPSHGEMLFRYVASLLQAGGVQAFTLAIAVPKDDGTSAVLSLAASTPTSTSEWREEIARLLGESATKAAENIKTAPEAKPEEKSEEA